MANGLAPDQALLVELKKANALAQKDLAQESTSIANIKPYFKALSDHSEKATGVLQKISESTENMQLLR